MHRMRIGLIAAGILLASTLGVFLAVTGVVKGAASVDVAARVQRGGRLFEELNRLKAVDFAKLAADRARAPQMSVIFDQADETARRKAAFAECEALNVTLQKESRKADIVAVLDAAGKIVARDLNPQAMYGDDLKAKYPAVTKALGGHEVKDVWTLADRVTEVALAPIRRQGGTVGGALLIGYVLSAAQAQEARELLNAEVGYFHEGKVQASSFVIAGSGGKEDTAKTQALGEVLFGGAKLAEQAVQKNALTPLAHATIEGRDYAVVAAPLVGNTADRTSGFVVLASAANAVESVKGVGPLTLLLGLLGVAVALGAAVMTTKRFLRPLDKIELGVEEVINGNIDYTFRPVGPDFEGLSNRLNVMLARLLGRDEPNEDAVEEEEAAQKWKAEQMVIEEGDGAALHGAEALAQESEVAYYPRLYNEYVGTLRAQGLPTDGLSVPAFMAKLRLAEAGLREKWTCKIVRFQLAMRGNQPIFRAVRVA